MFSVAFDGSNSTSACAGVPGSVNTHAAPDAIPLCVCHAVEVATLSPLPLTDTRKPAAPSFVVWLGATAPVEEEAQLDWPKARVTTTSAAIAIPSAVRGETLLLDIGPHCADSALGRP